MPPLFVDGWYAVRVADAGDYPLSGHPAGTPVAAARRRMPAPWPDVQHVLPLTRSAFVAMARGDPSVWPALAADFEASHRRFLLTLAGA